MIDNDAERAANRGRVDADTVQPVANQRPDLRAHVAGGGDDGVDFVHARGDHRPDVRAEEIRDADAGQFGREPGHEASQFGGGLTVGALLQLHVEFQRARRGGQFAHDGRDTGHHVADIVDHAVALRGGDVLNLLERRFETLREFRRIHVG